MLTMLMENHVCEDVLNWNTQARKDDAMKITVLPFCKVLLL